MVLAKKATKAPAVMVETKTMSAKDTCGMNCCGKIKHLLVPILLVINTILLVWVLCNQVSIEAGRVWGSDNYKMLKEIQSLPAFKAQYQQQLEQGLQMYKAGTTATANQQATTDTTAQAQANTAPVVTQ